ncbi:MAG TPA: LysR family transcriptional regulator [Firmicutes bacterium]|jgi:DNA-binding transcriptional LysR family regulator|nr:LysR family transcriptional regulator [Bacillota bacterium]
MTLTQLECFIAVAETLSFTKAAQKLSFVQSAVSSKIAELEKELGVELFIRTSKYVRLTDIGKQLLNNAYKIVALVDDCYIRCDRFKRGVTGHLVIGYVFPPTLRGVLSIFEKFIEERPEVDIQFRTYPDSQFAQACVEKEVDIIVTCPNSISSHLNFLAYKPLFKEKYQVVMSKTHHLAGAKKLSVEQLCTEDFCIMDRRVNVGIYSDIIAMFAKEDFSPHIVAEANAMTNLLLSVEMNNGITILPKSWQKSILNSDRFAFVDLEGSNTERIVGLAWCNNNTNPALKQFLKQLE